MTLEHAKYLDKIVKKIVEVAHPKKVILFGSAARDQMGPNSDFDLLVVVHSDEPRRRIAQKIYTNLVGVGFATDIIVVYDTDIEKYQEHPEPNSILQPALLEGRVLYAA